MNNLWGDVNPSQEKASLFDRCNISKQLCVCTVCVCLGCVILQSVFLSLCTLSPRQRQSLYMPPLSECELLSFVLCIVRTDKSTEVLFEWFQTLFSCFLSIAFDHFCLLRCLNYSFFVLLAGGGLADEDKKLIFIDCFHESPLIQVWGQGRAWRRQANRISQHLSPPPPTHRQWTHSSLHS